MTADDPFVDSEIVDILLSQASRMDARHSVISEDLSNRMFPLGYVPQVARVDRMRRSAAEIPHSESFHRSHVLSWLYSKGEAAVFRPPTNWRSRPNWRWTVDTPSDLQMAQSCFSLFGEQWSSMKYGDMERLLAEHPDISKINAAVRQKALEEA
jgi:spore coat polysaccharide biosynthesis protein SpsF (cytidylyltransferase family)